MKVVFITLLLFIQREICEVSLSTQVSVFSVAVTVKGVDNVTNCNFRISNDYGFEKVCSRCTSCIYYLFDMLIPSTTYKVKYEMQEDPYFIGSTIITTNGYSMKMHHENINGSYEKVSFLPSAFNAGMCSINCVVSGNKLIDCKDDICEENCDNLEYTFRFNKTTEVSCFVYTNRFPSNFNFTFTAERIFPSVIDVIPHNSDGLIIYVAATANIPYNTTIHVLISSTITTVYEEVFDSPETEYYIGDLTLHQNYTINVNFKLTTSECIKMFTKISCEIIYSKRIQLYSPSELEPKPSKIILSDDQVTIHFMHPIDVAMKHGHITCFLYVYGKIKNSDSIYKEFTSKEQVYNLTVGFWSVMYEMNSSACKSTNLSAIDLTTITPRSGGHINLFEIYVGAAFIICNSISCYSSGDYEGVYVKSSNYLMSATIATVLFVLAAVVAFIHIISSFKNDQNSKLKKNESVNVELK